MSTHSRKKVVWNFNKSLVQISTTVTRVHFVLAICFDQLILFIIVHFATKLLSYIHIQRLCNVHYIDITLLTIFLVSAFNQSSCEPLCSSVLFTAQLTTTYVHYQSRTEECYQICYTLFYFRTFHVHYSMHCMW